MRNKRLQNAAFSHRSYIWTALKFYHVTKLFVNWSSLVIKSHGLKTKDHAQQQHNLASKPLFTIFWTCREILFLELMLKRVIMNFDTYCSIPIKLRQMVRNKGNILLHFSTFCCCMRTPRPRATRYDKFLNSLWFEKLNVNWKFIPLLSISSVKQFLLLYVLRENCSLSEFRKWWWGKEWCSEIVPVAKRYN